MFRMFWSSSLAIAATLAISLALRFLAARWARGPEGGRRARQIAALRLGLVMLVVVVALAQLLTASSGSSWPVRWVLGVVGGVCALPWFVNAVAGLWLLSPFFRARPGDVIVACGHSGRIVGYGSTRLEVETEAGFTAYLPYVAVAIRPVLISNPSRARGMEFSIERSDWTEDKLQVLHEAAILAPYRDLSSPVRLARHADVVSVHLSLSRPGSAARMRRFLEAALQQAASSAPIRSGSAQADA